MRSSQPLVASTPPDYFTATSSFSPVDNDECDEAVCARCHRFSRLVGSPGDVARTKRLLCNCDPVGAVGCVCACGRPARTHVVRGESMRLEPWCARRRCGAKPGWQVAALSYKWPADFKDRPVALRVGGCVECGQSPSSDEGPWASMEAELRAVVGAAAGYRWVWVDHWCTRGVQDIPRLRAVYENADKVVVPLGDERGLWCVQLLAAGVLALPWVALLLAMLSVEFLVQLAGWAVTEAGSRAHGSVVEPACDVLGRLLAIVYCALMVVWACVGVPWILCLRLVTALAAGSLRLVRVLPWRQSERQGRFWLRLESHYARTAAVLLSSPRPGGEGGATGSFRVSKDPRWRVAIECFAGEWQRWLPGRKVVLYVTNLAAMHSAHAYSVGDKLLAAFVGRVDVRGFLRLAKEAGQEPPHVRRALSAQGLPSWLPARLCQEQSYRADSLMGGVIDVAALGWAAELVDEHGRRFLVVDAEFTLNHAVAFVELAPSDVQGCCKVHDWWVMPTFLPKRAVLTCRALSTTKLA